MLRRTVITLVAATTVSTAIAADWRGQFCVLSSQQPPTCVATTGSVVSIAPATTDRPFVWTDRLGRDAVVGVMRATARDVNLDAMSAQVVFRLDSTDREWRDPPDVELSQQDSAWRWKWSARYAGGQHTIRLPRGRYELGIKAPAHRALRRSIEADAKPLRLGILILPGGASITARIIDRDSKQPIPSARLTTSGVTLGSADSLGRVTADLPDDWNGSARIEANGYGAKLLDLPRGRADIEIGTVEMAPGSSIRVLLDGVPEGAIARLSADGRVVSEKPCDPLKAELRFDGLEPRSYHLVVHGSGPLQQIARRVEVHERRTEDVTVTAVAHRVRIRTFLGESALPNASVNLTNSEHRWQAALTTGDNGTAEAELWQPGAFLAWVTTAEIAVPFAKFVEMPDVREISVDLRLPDLRITGHVVDAQSGEPLSNSEVSLTTVRSDSTTSVLRAVVDSTGRFEYRAVAPGHQTVTGKAPGHVASSPVEFDMAEIDREREVTFRLARGVGRRIDVVDGAGHPMASARVAETAGGRLLGTLETDAHGSLDLTIPDGESRLVFVIPREGSFAVARVDAASSDLQPLRIVVPPPAGTLRITTRATDRSPIPEVMLLLRYNREVFPFEVLQLLSREQGLPFMTSAAGEAVWRNLPAGRYELWPAQDRREIDAVFAGGGAPPPVALDLAPGDNQALLTFSPMERTRKN